MHTELQPRQRGRGRCAPIGQGVAQSCGLHLLGGALGVVTRLRAVNNVPPPVHVRCTDGALTSATGALLLERLLAATGNHRRESWSRGCPDEQQRAERRQPGASAGCEPGHPGGRRREPLELQRCRCLTLEVGDVRVTFAMIYQAPFTAVANQNDAALGAGNGALDQRGCRSRRQRPDDGQVLGSVTVARPMRPAMRMPLRIRLGVAHAPDRTGLAVVLVRTVSTAVGPLKP